MRALPWLLVAMPLLAACSQPPSGPDLVDRGQLPEDIAAPPYEHTFEDEVPFDPPGVPWIFGRVLDAQGRPVPGAHVWVETVDLRDRSNNVDAYTQGRDQTLTVTDATGRFRMELDEAFYRLTVQAAGHRLLRSVPVPAIVEAEMLELRLGPPAPAIVAHRGASFHAPENTISSLWKAKWLGATHVEVDLRLTRDGHLVGFHDPELERTTNGTGRLRDHTLAELRRLDAGSWFDESFAGEPMPTLEELLEAAREAELHLVLDLKSPPDRRLATWDRTITTILQHDATSRVTFAVFREEGIERCARVPGLACMWLRQDDGGHPDLPWAAQQLGATWLGLDASLVSSALVDAAHARGIQVMAWTLNEPETWRPVLEHGVDAMATDRMGFLVDDLNGVPLQMD